MSEKARRRLRSSTVILGSMGALAAALTSCGSEPDKRCVDRNSYDAVKGYRVVDSAKCSARGNSSSGAGGTNGGTGGYGKNGRGSGTGKRAMDAQWYYDPSSKGGAYADAGTFSKATAVNRGGFGCSGSGSGKGSGGSHGRIGG
ncbi:hypothetical protein SSP35_01_03640 [Streptomyces sp. NBRC 110611]|uniref:hypothetical protein n=1 Tax=Streptomyces sp. NBRC 110611 TaxID=1621259 RepID=UPI00082A7A76|nr:hypothetical protein [Streptomyces sp. NBRC 110611]GAU65027.1 hypothetical protein SSP35_01_03640 [Streptomyces sp. NBRC 110611]